jgi:hypothetical protein
VHVSAVDAKPLDRRLQKVPYPSPYDMAVAGLCVMRYSLQPQLPKAGGGWRGFQTVQLPATARVAPVPRCDPYATVTLCDPVACTVV